MPLTYYAPNLNRVPNAFYIRGNGLPREDYNSTAIYNYTRGGAVDWATARSSATAGTVGNTVVIVNRFTATYTITRTGVQFSTTWGIVPVGMRIRFSADTEFNLPFKIRAFKGTTTALTGATSEYSIPLSEGLIPFSEEIEVTSIETSLDLYFNQTAIDAFLANPDQNIFILGEYDYNNIAPTVNHTVGNTDPGAVVELTGQT